MKPKTERIYIRVTEDLKKKLEENARKENRTVSNYVLTIIQYHLEKGDEKMKKFEIIKNTLEIKNENEYFEGCTFAYDGDQDPEILETYNTKDEAIAELKKFKSNIRRGSKNLKVVTEYYVEENEYNEDEEFLNLIGVVEYAPMEKEDDGIAELIGKTMTVLELSEELIKEGYSDIYDIGTLEENIEEGSIAVDEKLIEFEIIEKLEGLDKAKIKITDITEY